jgi:DNA-binding transcriptional LysR family regulator
LASHPLVLQDPAFIVRRVFDAACRLAGVKPDILLESRAPHTLVAMAEAGHGIAIIPSALRTARYKVRLYGVTYRNKPLREQLVMLWDKRRPLPPYATNFCETLAEHFRTIFPISRPSASGGQARVRLRSS